MDNTAQLLYDYLQKTLHHQTASLDPVSLPADCQPLGRLLVSLTAQLKEAEAFGLAVAEGNLSVNPPGQENTFAVPMARLQDSLCRITLQAQQAAKGDYTQHMDFPAELSAAFNNIVDQLQASIENSEIEKQVLLDSIQALDDTSWELEKSNQELRNNLALVRALTDYTNNMIFVYSVENGQEVHCNRSADWFRKSHPQTAEELVRNLINQQPDIQRLIEQRSEKRKSSDAHQDSVIWNMELNRADNMETVFYQVESFLIPWFSPDPAESGADKKHAVVHIVMDETERKNQQNMIYRLAYIDPLTNLNNRRYAMEKMELWLQEGISFTLSFIDVDYLKYYNDTFGHEKGDEYLIEISNALQTLEGEVCRVGGDEFFLLQTEITPEEQDERLERLRGSLQAHAGSGCPRSFSYATSAIPAHTEVPLDTYIQKADEKMYEYKQKYKVPLKDVLYHDDRL